METQTWTLLEVSVPSPDREFASQVFWELGTVGVEEWETGKNSHFAVFFPSRRMAFGLKKEFQKAAQQIPFTFQNLKVSTFQDNPNLWIQNFRNHFQGLEVAGTFFVHPSWRKPVAKYPISIQIDPGQAFGTGTHESTQLCLEALVHLAPQSSNLLDVGTGSGILSVAAYKLNSFIKIIALDLDKLAVFEASKNSCINETPGISYLIGTPASLIARFDLVIANLSLNTFRKEATDLEKLVGRNLCLSGFTLDQVDEVQEYFTLQLVNRWELNQWCCLHLRNV